MSKQACWHWMGLSHSLLLGQSFTYFLASPALLKISRHISRLFFDRQEKKFLFALCDGSFSNSLKRKYSTEIKVHGKAETILLIPLPLSHCFVIFTAASHARCILRRHGNSPFKYI